MPQVNLSSLNTSELRRLLDATRARGDAAQSYRILQEMAARRESREQRAVFPMRRPAEPQLVTVDLGDPMEPADELPPMPSWRAPLPEPEPAPEPPPRRSRGRKAQPAESEAAAAEPVATPVVEAAPPDPEPPPADPADPAAPLHRDLRLHTPTVESPRALSGLRRGLAAGFVAGAALGAATGWWVGARQAPPPQAAPAAAPIQTAALAPPPAQVPAQPPAPSAAAESEPAPETPPAQAAELPTEGPPSPPNAPAGEPTGVALELPQPAPAHPAAETAACAAEPTPADREICGDPALRRLQRELRQAYAQALEAHQDRDLLRQRQLAWKDARDTVSDPDRLARLYEERIRKLNAATAEARRAR